MTVNPGLRRPEFPRHRNAEDRRRAADDRRVRAGRSRLSVDGGIAPETAPRAIAAGADTLVAGTAVFGAPRLCRGHRRAARRGGRADERSQPTPLAARCAPGDRPAAEPADGPGAGCARAAGARSLARRCRPRRPAAARANSSSAAASAPLRPGSLGRAVGFRACWRAAAHGFTWLRDLRALGTDAARLRARALVAEWVAAPPADAARAPAGRRRRPDHRLARPLRFLRRHGGRCVPPAADGPAGRRCAQPRRPRCRPRSWTRAR